MAETILRLQNISKYYYSDTSVTQALRKINLEFSMESLWRSPERVEEENPLF